MKDLVITKIARAVTYSIVLASFSTLTMCTSLPNTQNSNHPVFADIVFLSKDNVNPLSKELTSKNIIAYQPDEKRVKAVCEFLIAKGMKCEYTGGISANIQSTKTLFEEIFSTKLYLLNGVYSTNQDLLQPNIEFSSLPPHIKSGVAQITLSQGAQLHNG